MFVLGKREQLSEEIYEYVDYELYSLKYAYLCIRPNGLKSFSFSIDNPYTFGNALDGISVENDERLKNYISSLREIDKELLIYALDKVAINYDYLVDERINKHYFSRG